MHLFQHTQLNYSHLKYSLKKAKQRCKPYLITLLLAIIAIAPVTSTASEMILKDFDGQFKSLSDYTGKGKWTIVMLWASDCHVCNQEVSEYMAFHTKHKQTDATVLGVSLDGDAKKKDAQEFLDRHKVNFPSLIGEPAFVASGYLNITGINFSGTPTFLIFGPDGNIKAQQAGAVPTKLIEEFMKQETPAKPG